MYHYSFPNEGFARYIVSKTRNSLSGIVFLLLNVFVSSFVKAEVSRFRILEVHMGTFHLANYKSCE